MAASRWMGRGDKNGADGAAVNAMRTVLSTVPMDGIVVIGEGEKDNAPMLFNGEQIGDGTPPDDRHRGRPDRRHHAHRAGSRWRSGRHRRVRAGRHVRPRARASTWRSSPSGPGPRAPATSAARPTENLLRALPGGGPSGARPHRGHPRPAPPRRAHRRGASQRARASGSSPTATWPGAIATGWPGAGADILFGIGGTPEGVLAAAALKCMGGEIQGRL